MRHGSLFSGIGGFDLAASWMGWENIFHCENNEFCQKVLKHHFPKSIQHGDIKETDFTYYRGLVDIVTGGFPCQPYSTAGKRKGNADDRHLWPQMLRAIKEIQPTWIVGENVPGLLNWKRGMVLYEIVTDLEAAGFEVFPPVILPAGAVGADHNRKRVWVVAYSKQFGLEKPIQENGGSQELYKWREPNPFNGNFSRYGFDLFRSDDHLRNRDGLSNWVDRIKGLGNAIVPQIAFEIFKVIENLNHNI